MTVKLNNIFLMLGFISALVSTLLFELLPKGAFYYFNSFAFVCYSAAIFFKTEKSFGIFRRIEIMVLLCTISNFIDELFCDATVLEFNDLIRLFSILIITYKCKNI